MRWLIDPTNSNLSLPSFRPVLLLALLGRILGLPKGATWQGVFTRISEGMDCKTKSLGQVMQSARVNSSSLRANFSSGSRVLSRVGSHWGSVRLLLQEAVLKSPSERWAIHKSNECQTLSPGRNCSRRHLRRRGRFRRTTGGVFRQLFGRGIGRIDQPTFSFSPANLDPMEAVELTPETICGRLACLQPHRFFGGPRHAEMGWPDGLLRSSYGRIRGGFSYLVPQGGPGQRCFQSDGKRQKDSLSL